MMIACSIKRLMLGVMRSLSRTIASATERLTSRDGPSRRSTAERSKAPLSPVFGARCRTNNASSSKETRIATPMPATTARLSISNTCSA